MPAKLTQEQVIEKFVAKHGYRYDYSRVVYSATRKKVEILCRAHGSFWQRADTHQAGSGCPMCANYVISQKLRGNLLLFIARAREVHGDFYDYSDSVYTTDRDRISITCPVHGPFISKPSSHLSGSGCRKCAYEAITITNETFLARAHERHGDLYDYSETVYTAAVNKVSIVCPKHGRFETSAQTHISGGGGCRKCARENHRSDTKKFIASAKEVHGGRYDYSLADYCLMGEQIRIICKEHGEFLQTPAAHLAGSGCQICAGKVSSAEVGIRKLLTSHDIRLTLNTFAKLGNRELDILTEDGKLAVEHSGLHWHSVQCGRDHRYHLDKLERSRDIGIRLITVFEDEWKFRRKVAGSLILAAAGVFDAVHPISGVRVVRQEEAEVFFFANHLVGYQPADAYLGLDDVHGLSAAASFSLGPSEAHMRFCCRAGTKMAGALGKLSMAAPWPRVVGYADLRWFTGQSFLEAGFVLEEVLPPKSWRANGQRRFTEEDATRDVRYEDVFDCGELKFALTK